MSDVTIVQLVPVAPGWWARYDNGLVAPVAAWALMQRSVLAQLQPVGQPQLAERYVVGLTIGLDRFVPDGDGQAEYFYDPTWKSGEAGSE
jgi:hypothetical protein